MNKEELQKNIERMEQELASMKVELSKPDELVPYDWTKHKGFLSTINRCGNVFDIHAADGLSPVAPTVPKEPLPSR